MRHLRRMYARLFERESPAILVFGRLFATALTLTSAPLVARILGPEGRGETAAAIAAFVIIPLILGLGVPLEIRRIIAIHDEDAIVRSGRMLCLISFLASILLGFLAYGTVFSSFHGSARFAASLGVALGPLWVSWACDISTLVARGRFRAVAFLQVVQPLVYVISVGILWLAGLGSTASIIYCNLAGLFISFLVSSSLVRCSPFGEIYAISELSRGGIKFAGSSIAEGLSNKIDQIICLSLIGAYQAGIYSVAATIGAVPLVLGHALGAAYFREIARAKGPEVMKLKSNAIRSAILTSILIVPTVGVLSTFLIPFAFGQEFRPAVSVMWVVLIGSAAMLVNYVCSMCLAAEGKGWRMTLAQFAGVAIGIAALLLCGPLLGALGAGLASSIAYSSVLIILISALKIPMSSLRLRRGDFREAITRFRGA